MQKQNPEIDNFLNEGCGRCDKWRTPECKVHNYTEALSLLRQIVLSCGLKEELKWSQPCYTYQNKNVLIMSAFKDYCFISFFKGALLKDPAQLLHRPGQNSQAARQLRFTQVQEVQGQAEQIKSYILEALNIQKAGLSVPFKKDIKNIPDELSHQFKQHPAFQTAFEALTPGRQRGYLLYFSGAKQSKTRTSRIEKQMPRIFEGLGMHDR